MALMVSQMCMKNVGGLLYVCSYKQLHPPYVSLPSNPSKCVHKRLSGVEFFLLFLPTFSVIFWDSGSIRWLL